MNSEPLPWELAVEELQNMPPERLRIQLQTMASLHQDYKDVLLVYNDLRGDMKRAITQMKELQHSVDRAAEKLDEEREQRVLAEEQLKRSEAVVDALARRQASDTPVGSEEPKERRSTKLPDPPILTDGLNPTFDDWIEGMRDKLRANADHYNTEDMKMAYLASRVGGKAKLQLSSRRRPDAINPFRNAEAMLEALIAVFEDPDRRQTAAQEFQKLYQGKKSFNDFWGEFQRLTAELNMDEATLLFNLHDKLSLEQKEALLNDSSTNVLELAQKCRVVDRRLQGIKAQKSRSSRFRAATSSATSPVNLANSNRLSSESRPVTPTRPSTIKRELTPNQLRLKQEARCFFCKEPGHMATACPDKASKAAISLVEEFSDSGKE